MFVEEAEEATKQAPTILYTCFLSHTPKLELAISPNLLETQLEFAPEVAG